MSKMSFKEKLISKVVETVLKNYDEPPIIAPVTKKLSECKVALVTTAGVHLKDQEPYNTKAGDHTFRIIPNNTSMNDLMITHGHYDDSEAKKDINCVFPIERLHELKEEGYIGEIASNHIGFMGYIPNVEILTQESAPEVAKILKEDKVDIVILSPG